jgi:sarcosine oxidase subunit beta
VVLATGAWSKNLVAKLGEQIPLKPRISQIAMIRPESEVNLPLINDPDLRIYYRSELDGDVLFGGGNDNVELDPDTFSPVAKESFLHDIAEKVPRVFRSLADSPVSSKWSGLCSATPDRHPLVGELDAEGFYVCCGFNGEGIMFSPAAGRIIADLIVDRETPFTRDEWAPDRFEEITDFEIKSAIDW